MTRDEIIRITTQILGQVRISSPHLVGDQVVLMCTIDDVGRLIDGVAALEREKCAQACDDRAKASGKWALIESVADDIDELNQQIKRLRIDVDAAKGMLKLYNGLLVDFADALDVAPYHLTAQMAVEKINRLRTIEAAARNLAKVKGRHNSEIAMNQLLESLK